MEPTGLHRTSTLQLPSAQTCFKGGRDGHRRVKKHSFLELSAGHSKNTTLPLTWRRQPDRKARLGSAPGA